MAVKKITICGNCKKAFSTATQGKCPNCGNKLTGDEVGTTITTELRMEGRRPTSKEMERLKNVPFKRIPVSKEESNKGLKNIATGIIATPLIILFGLWVISSFKGPGTLIFGYGSILVSPVIAFLFIGSLGINILIRDPRKKTIAKVFHWMWKESYQNALIDGKENSFNYAYGTIMRTVPDSISGGISKETLKTYLRETREALVKTMDESDKELDLSLYWKNDVVKNARDWKTIFVFEEHLLQLEREEEIENGVCEATGSFVITKTLQWDDSNDTLELDIAALLVKVHGYYIKNGDYWLPYDLMPELSNVKELTQ